MEEEEEERREGKGEEGGPFRAFPSNALMSPI